MNSVKAFSWFNSSTEKAKENLKKQGEELDKLNKKYDEHIEKMKALCPVLKKVYSD